MKTFRGEPILPLRSPEVQELSPVYAFATHIPTTANSNSHPTLSPDVKIMPNDITSSTAYLRGEVYDFAAIPSPQDAERCIIIGEKAVQHFGYIVGAEAQKVLNGQPHDNHKRDKLAMLSRRVVFLSALENTNQTPTTKPMIDRKSIEFRSALDYMTKYTFLCVHKAAERIFASHMSNELGESLQNDILKDANYITQTSRAKYIYSQDTELTLAVQKSAQRHLSVAITVLADNTLNSATNIRAELHK